jgi:hypothetical protein
MSSIEKLNFKALSIDGANYLSWALDVEVYLASKGLDDTISTDTGPTMQQRAQALMMIRHHLEEPLKIQYMNELNPRRVWEELKSRFDHLKLISLPAARHDWMNLRVQDFNTIAAYNSELFRITAQLAICGHPVPEDEMIEKTLSTFHAANIILASQYRNMAFRRYSELIAYMLLAEKHQILLLDNSKLRPAGSAPPP